MKYYCLFLIILVSSSIILFVTNAHYDNFDYEDRIVDGYSVDIKNFPYQVALIIDGEFRCGGCIVSFQFILTAAHCVKFNDPQDVVIRAGSTYVSEGGIIAEVEEIYIHENYTHKGTPDIAVLELIENLPDDNDNIQIIELASCTTFIKPGTVILVSGWGKLRNSDLGGSEVLQAITVPTVTLEECKRAYAVVLPHTVKDYCFCASTANHKGSCHGDSGGPAASEDGEILYGIVAFGHKCSLPRYPGVYMNIAAFRDWIEDITGL